MSTEKPTAPGEVVLSAYKVHSIGARNKAKGEIHIGMMGATVIRPDGSSVLYPWRVIDWVEFDKPSP